MLRRVTIVAIASNILGRFIFSLTPLMSEHVTLLISRSYTEDLKSTEILRWRAVGDT